MNVVLNASRNVYFITLTNLSLRHKIRSKLGIIIKHFTMKIELLI